MTEPTPEPTPPPKITKSKALTFLRKAFPNARISVRPIAGASIVSQGEQRWQLWFQGRTGQMPVVEVSGPVGKLPWVLVVEAYKRINIEVWSDGTGIYAKRAAPVPTADTSAPGQNATP